MGTETDEFARQLRRLKERSGRSYGVLAGQLHMSVSTLHRYCNGDAVPMDFAPADRLARWCGATSDELVELHRRWILADEARRRSRAGSAGAIASAPAAASSSDQPAPSSNEPADTSADKAADTAAASASAAPPADAHAHALGGNPDPDSPRASDSPATPDQPASEPAPSRRLTYLRIALAVTAVACLAVPAALAVDAPKAGDAEQRSAHSAHRHPAASDAPTRLPKRPAPGHSAAARKPTPSGKARHTRPGPERSDGPAASPAPEDDRGGTAPRVGVSSYNWDQPCGVNYLLQKSPDRVPPPPPPQDFRGWARAEGGIDGGHLRLQLTATGRTADAVVLTSLHVRVVGRHTALPWSAYEMGNGCGGGITPRAFAIDLDDAQPLAKPMAGQDGDIVVPAKNFPFKVSTQDPQVLNLDLHTEGHDVSWYLEVGWSSGSRRGTISVDDGGKPFRTSAIKGREHYSYRSDTNRWVTDE
ncbi:transcriptional regulator [Streptomyces glebosus]|uniref:Transcriptional regulator n=1 Tax=Streptomyces glebosus TaxID=249580 RepID=A0A640T8C7_9ACTN|nr:helix-turn-helix transcriptional regulator [Streptomyces glebosus]GFE18721.1 transcriptional regulator [Streptomyces glebosus]GHG49940.1 transcriptional regulator [Streptomyces glebosus]